MIQFSDELR